MNRIVALVWGAAALVMAYWALSIGLGPKADASGWLAALGFAGAAAYCIWRTVQEWTTPEAGARNPIAPNGRPQSPPTSAGDFPGAWRGPPIPLETQIAALRDAGLAMAPGRTIDELLTSWPRARYEDDPYNLILFMYGCQVEAEPWGRVFCERGWDFDMECLIEKGDYVRAFEQIVRITGQPQLVSEMSDSFRFDAEVCEIRYVIQGRNRVLKARIDNDWADPDVVAAFVRDIEAAIGDGRHFWASDNGQSSILFFLTDAEAAKVNALRADIVERYVGP